MGTLIQELRYALRMLVQRPLFALVAIASIAIGVGANTAIFSVFDTLLLQPPRGVGEPERVVELGRTMRGGGFDTFSFPELVDFQREVPSLDRVAGWRVAQMSLSTGAEGERVTAMAVSQPYFEALGTAPWRGRFFEPAEDRAPGTGAVVVLSHAFWSDRLGGDPSVIGRTISLNRQEFTVIGIARPEFRGHLPALAPSLYFPLTMWGAARPGANDFDARYASWLQVVARLAPGATVAGVDAELGTLFARLATAYPDVYGGENRRAGRAAPLSGIPAAGRTPVLAFLSLLLGLVVMILLTTCANVAGMLLARAASREREITVRLALGAGRARLVRQLLLESLLLFGIGGAAGVALGFQATSLLSSLPLPVPIPVDLEFTPALRVLLAGFGVALLTGVLFGLVPALQSTRPDLASAMKREGPARNTRASRSRRWFVAAEVGLSLVLLISAGLFLRALQRASHIETGFDPAGVRMVSFDLAIDGYDEQTGRTFVRTLLERLEATPGVEAAGTTNDLPLDLGIRETGVFPEGWKGTERFGFPTAFSQITPGYMAAVAVKLAAGRDFTANDGPGAPGVVIVSRGFAERVWPGANPLGRRLRFGDGDTAWYSVVGVAENVKNTTLMESTKPALYVPVAQMYAPELTLVVRSTLPAAAANESVRRAIASIDPRLSMTPVQSLAEYTGLGMLPQRIAAGLTSALGLLALLLSSLGVYGIMAFTVAQRTREIGVRMALGAGRSTVLRDVLRNSLRLVLPGLAVGAAGALALAQVMRSFILGVPPVDPVTFVGVPLLLAAVVLVASWVPAARAASVDPIHALRAE